MSDDIDRLFDPEDFETDFDVEFTASSDSPVADALTSGLAPELVDSLREITQGTGDNRHVSILLTDSADEATHSMATELSQTDTFETFDVEVKHEQANALLKHVYSELNDAHTEYGDVDTIVLGLPQFHVLEPWARAEHNKGIASVLPVDVLVVPGPVIHPVVDNQVLYTEYLRNKENDDGD